MPRADNDEVSVVECRQPGEAKTLTECNNRKTLPVPPRRRSPYLRGDQLGHPLEVGRLESLQLK